MSRLENKKKLGFVQLGRQETEKLSANDAMHCEDTRYIASLIASYIAPAPDGTRFMSPCSGYGAAEHHMCAAWGIPTSHRWFAEMHDGRAKGAEAQADHVICGDALTITVKGNQFDVAYLNPPFDTEGTEQGGERFEHQFFNRFLFGKYTVVPGGIGIYVAPQDVIAMEKNANHIARVFDSVIFLALPADLRRYRETVVIGVVRNTTRKYHELLEEGDKHRKTLMGPLPTLEEQSVPMYTWPSIPAKRADVLWHSPANSTPANALRDVIQMGGAWSSSAYVKRQKKIRQRSENLRPLFPPTSSGAILGVASGKINNKVVEFGGRRMTIKGSTRIIRKERTEIEHDGDTEKTVTHCLEQHTPFIVTVDQESGAVGQYMGDKGISHLADISGAVDAMIQTYKESVPPIYNGIIPDDINAILSGLVPMSGKALPGQTEAGFVMMQKHCAAAIMEGFTFDPKLFLNMDMGAGKTRTSLGIIECLRLLRPTNDGRDFTVIVTGPATVVGSRESVEQHDVYHANRAEFAQRFPRGKVPKHISQISQWTAEVRELLPHWDSVILETPSQVRAFFNRAKQNTGKPIIGIMSLSWLALGMGRVVGTTTHPGTFPSTHPQDDDDEKRTSLLMSRQGFRSDIHERAKDELKIHQDAEKALRKKKAQRYDVPEEVVENITDDERKLRSRISPRTKARDRLFRCGVMRSSIPQWHYSGEYCPDCGRHIVTADGVGIDREKIYRDGNKGHTKGICRWCKTKVVSAARVFDSIKDIAVPLYDSPAYHAWYEDEQDVVTSVRVDETHVEDVTLYEAFTVVGRKCVPLDVNTVQRNTDGTDRVVTVTTTTRIRGSLEKRVQRAIPWGIRPKSNPRMALGEFIKKAFGGMVDVYVADEIHKHKGRDTDQGAMFAAIVAASHRTLGLTGTVYGGKASTVFSLFQRLDSRPLRERFGWDDEKEFVREMGIIETITTQTTKSNTASRKISGRGDDNVKTVEKERAGITASLAQMIWAKAVIVILKQMGFHLPDYHEDLHLLELPDDVHAAYKRLQSWGEETVKEPGGRDCLSSWLQACLVFPYAPWDASIHAFSRYLDSGIYPALNDEGKPRFPRTLILPHHRKLTEIAIAAKKEGHGVIIFCEHTRKIDIQLDIQRKMIELAQEEFVDLKIDIMRSSVKGADRIGWFAERHAAGINVVLCHPSLVDTGVNLIDWPIINFAEPGYKLATAMQAKKRAYRPTQTKPCQVNWFGYAATMSARAIAIISTKMLSAALLGGDDISGGIFRSDDGMSLLQTLAKQITSGVQDDVVDLRARVQRAGQATVKDMTQGAADLFGIPVPEEVFATLPDLIEELPTTVVAYVEEIAEQLADELTATLNFRPFRNMPKSARKGIRRDAPENDNVLQAEMF